MAQAKATYEVGRRRVYRPWIPERGMWLQYDWSDGPEVRGRPTSLFWLAWSRYRVVLPTWDRVLGTVSESSRANLIAELNQLGTNLLTATPGNTFLGQTAVLPHEAPATIGRLASVQLGPIR